MEHDEGPDDEQSLPPRWLPPDDRLWRHPSELAAAPRPLQLPAPPDASGRAERPGWLLALLGGVVGALLTAGLIFLGGGFDREEVTVRPVERVENPAVPVDSAGPRDADTVVQIAERVRPAIVQLQVSGGEGSGSGSGVLFRSDGHILTNHHVVDGARSVVVVMADGEEHEGRVVGTDPDTDIAVVDIDGENLPTALLGSAERLRVGQLAIAIGSPLGLAGGPSVSVGVVSALGRRVDGRDGPPLLDMIQTDAPIAPGSSGGALVDAAGAVIGVTTAIGVSDVGAEGLGFATPIDIARDVADQLMETGRAVHVWLGVEGEDLDRASARTLGVEGGARVKRVRDDTPAEAGGLKARDVIVAVDGEAVTSMAALVVALRSHRPGDDVSLDVLRGGKRLQLRVTLKARPADV